MLFQRKHDKNIKESVKDSHTLVMEALLRKCNNGFLNQDAFVLKSQGIYVYADVISLKNNVVQIAFQIHHEWLDDVIVETIAARGMSDEEAIDQACDQFIEMALSLYIKAVNEPEHDDCVEAFTQERHYFHVYRGAVGGIGKREGKSMEDFWDMLEEDIAMRLGNKRVYWVKVFVSNDGETAESEVRINGKDAKELSEKLLSYAKEWDLISTCHTEKQCILLLQDVQSYRKSIFSKEEIQLICERVIPHYEKCKNKKDQLKVRKQLEKWCGDRSLAYEIFGLIPELYCRYAYPDVEFGERLYMIQKGKRTKEFYQSQLQSFGYVEDIVEKHLRKSPPSKEVMKRMLSFSPSAKAIERSLQEGEEVGKLMTPGIGYLAPSSYILR